MSEPWCAACRDDASVPCRPGVLCRAQPVASVAHGGDWAAPGNVMQESPDARLARATPGLPGARSPGSSALQAAVPGLGPAAWRAGGGREWRADAELAARVIAAQCAEHDRRRERQALADCLVLSLAVFLLTFASLAGWLGP